MKKALLNNIVNALLAWKPCLTFDLQTYTYLTNIFWYDLIYPDNVVD